MNASSNKSNIAVFLAVLATSAAIMIALFWLFPLTTAVVAIGLFVLLGLAARLARAIDVPDISDLDHRV
jgi:hypothetical protein